LSSTRIELGKALAAAMVVVGCCLGVAKDARATLGGDAASVVANEKTLAATRRVEKVAAGDRHELTLPSGIVVHEYVSPSGAVYAITWSGPHMPDLRELLGAYFPQLASRSRRGGHHRVSLNGADFVLQSQGHHHTFSGRAWVPSLVPAGVKIDASIQ
jgi:hypothetical protein